MSNTYFEFKQFRISQEHSAMKVGTDGVLLGAWASVDKARRILDIGTGTGLIALMLAQRNSCAYIDAIEVDESSYKEALENVKQSKWFHRISVLHKGLAEYSPVEKYDLIVTNPPFFDSKSSFAIQSKGRSVARQTHQLTFELLARKVKALLADDGKFSVILPYGKEAVSMESLLEEQGLESCRSLSVLPTPQKAPKRKLMEFSFCKLGEQKVQETDMIIEEFGRHIYSERYIELTKTFYKHI